MFVEGVLECWLAQGILGWVRLTFLADILCTACGVGFRVEVVWPVFCMSNAG